MQKRIGEYWEGSGEIRRKSLMNSRKSWRGYNSLDWSGLYVTGNCRFAAAGRNGSAQSENIGDIWNIYWVKKKRKREMPHKFEMNPLIHVPKWH